MMIKFRLMDCCKSYLLLQTSSLFYFLARRVCPYTLARQKRKCLEFFCKSGFAIVQLIPITAASFIISAFLIFDEISFAATSAEITAVNPAKTSIETVIAPQPDINIGTPTSKQGTETITTSKAIDQIQQSLIYSDAQKTEQGKTKIVIKHSEDEVKSKDQSKPKINIAIAEPKINKQEEQKQKLAHKAASDGQYEVAVELYKQILKSNPKNHYAEFSLASCYHLLGQYSQAKTLYYKLLKYDWQDGGTKNELINNFVSLIVEESPSEAVYLLSELSNQNPGADYIVAGAAMAYDKINQSDKAILLLKKAININSKEIKYKFNLAVIYDKVGDYRNALNYYQYSINDYIANDDIDSPIPVEQVKQRIQFIQNKI